MICRKGTFLDWNVKRVNFLLKLICEKNGYFFIDNSNIEIRDLRKDGIHLLESCKTKLGENFIYFLNNSYGLSPYDYVLDPHTHGNIEHTYSQFEPISTKNILHTDTSNEVNNENNLLKNLRLKSSNKVIIGHININSLRNKFEHLTEMVRDKVDLLMISETKLDSSFPNAQLYMKSYSKPYRLDRTSEGEVIILYVRKDIPSKLINSSCTDHDKEYFLVELNLRKQTLLIICNYNPHKTMIKGYLEYISKEIDSHSSKYDNFLLLGDFNSEPTEEAMKSFCQI